MPFQLKVVSEPVNNVSLPFGNSTFKGGSGLTSGITGGSTHFTPPQRLNRFPLHASEKKSILQLCLQVSLGLNSMSKSR